MLEKALRGRDLWLDGCRQPTSYMRPYMLMKTQFVWLYH